MESFEALVRKAQCNEGGSESRQAAFGELVRRFEQMVFDRAFSILGDGYLAQDMAQEAFITAYQNLDQLQSPRAFPNWLKRIVFTECNRLRRKKGLYTEPLERELPSSKPDPEAEMVQQELREKVRAAIEKLPDHERTVTELFYLEGFSQNDISRMVGVPVKTVKSRLYSSRQRLLELMREALVDLEASTYIPDAQAPDFRRPGQGTQASAFTGMRYRSYPRPMARGGLQHYRSVRYKCGRPAHCVSKRYLSVAGCRLPVFRQLTFIGNRQPATISHILSTDR